MLNNNDNNECFFKVAKIISGQLNIDETRVSPNSSFSDLGADSLDQIEILMKIEESFNIEISDLEAETVQYVKDLVKCISKEQ